jgi:hypothetical protein
MAVTVPDSYKPIANDMYNIQRSFGNRINNKNNLSLKLAQVLESNQHVNNITQDISNFLESFNTFA